jgi:hypothetical protein
MQGSNLTIEQSANGVLFKTSTGEVLASYPSGQIIDDTLRATDNSNWFSINGRQVFTRFQIEATKASGGTLTPFNPATQSDSDLMAILQFFFNTTMAVSGGGGSSGGASESTLAELRDAVGAQIDSPAGSDTGGFSLLAFIKRISGYLGNLLKKTDFEARIPTNGQKTGAGSLPVVVASDQSALNVAATSTPSPTGQLLAGRRISTSGLNQQVFKIGSTKLVSLWVKNRTSGLGATEIAVKIYNKSTNPVSADIPQLTIVLSAGETAQLTFPEGGLLLSSGYAIQMTTGIADNDSGSIAANAIVFNSTYK